MVNILVWLTMLWLSFNKTHYKRITSRAVWGDHWPTWRWEGWEGEVVQPWVEQRCRCVHTDSGETGYSLGELLAPRVCQPPQISPHLRLNMRRSEQSKHRFLLADGVWGWYWPVLCCQRAPLLPSIPWWRLQWWPGAWYWTALPCWYLRPAASQRCPDLLQQSG